MTPQEWLDLHRRAGQGDEEARAALLEHHRKVERAQVRKRAREAAAEVAFEDFTPTGTRRGLYARPPSADEPQLCPNGHPTELKGGRLRCRTCVAAAERRRYWERKALAQ